MLVGIFAGLLAFGFAKAFGEPQIERAIAFETQMEAGEGHDSEPELVSRKVQSGIGLLTGIAVYSTAIGGLFSLAFAFAYGRMGDLGPRAIAALVAAAGFVTGALVPTLKYPPNPPSVGLPETIGWRTESYFLLIVIALAALGCAILMGRWLAGRLGTWNAALGGAAVFLSLIVAAQLFLPDIDEVPAQFSAVLLWHFRVASLGVQAVLWTTLGLLFGALTERDLAARCEAE